MKKTFITIILALVILPLSIYSQNVITGIKADPGIKIPTVESNLAHFDIYQIDILKSDIKITSSRRNVDFILGEQTYKLNLFNDNVTISYESPNLPQLLGGSLNKGGEVSLTINDNFIYGFIRHGDSYLFIEPLKYFEAEAADNLFVVYQARDVIDTGEHVCGVTESEIKSEAYTPYKMPTTTCYVVDFAIANTYDMYTGNGNSVANVENHNLGVLNNVQTNYRSEFDANLEFDVVAHFIPTSSGADPFSSSNQASTLLNSITNWGNGGGNNSGASGGFGVNYNQATLWTDRDICSGASCGTVGLAWTPGWHSVLENYTSSAASLMAMVSHEKGHNYSALHDASGTTFIMAPFVTITTEWSTASKNSINNRLATLTYLSDCSTLGPPEANFFQSSIAACTGSSIEFEDQSQYGDDRDWEFFGGTPATSTSEKPSVMYNTPGLYGVKLVASNSAGVDSTVYYVDIETEPGIQCSPNGAGGSGGITFVSMANISNSSGNASSAGRYENFVCTDIASLDAGVGITMFVTTANTGTHYLSLFADYNDDGDFSDGNENPSNFTLNSGAATYSIPYTPISTPTLGSILRFRIIVSSTSISGNECHNPTNGQVEDYGIYFDVPQIFGCTDPGATNYDPNATVDDGSCEYGSTTWYRDFDNDTFGDINVTQNSGSQPAGYVADNTDCDDTDNTVYPGAPELCDGQINNCNTGALPGIEVDNDGDQFVECIIDAGGWDGVGSVVGGDDCDDNDALNFPGNTEVCDNQDNDCDGMVDEGVLNTYFEDNDSDGFGNNSSPIQACSQPGGYVANNTDCNDGDGTVYPGAPELCDGQINNCNTGSLPGNEDDNDFDQYVECTWDAGGWDGTPDVVGGGDCNDNDNAQFPGNPEVCDLKDNDCNGFIDDGIGTVYYEDADSDGFGNLFSPTTNCNQPAGYVLNSTDCDDTDGTVFPGAPELCDGQINNCNTGTLPGNEVDNDGDQYVECVLDADGWDGPGTVVGGEDCDDTDSSIHPGATEICDGNDNNCDGNTDENCATCDGDFLIVNVITKNTYRAEINILSHALIDNGQSILFTAGTDIDLDEDFEVVVGTQFEARIEDCLPPTFKEEDEVIYLRSGNTGELVDLVQHAFGGKQFTFDILDNNDNIIYTGVKNDNNNIKSLIDRQINKLALGIYLIKFFDGNKTVAQRVAIVNK